MYLRKGRIYSLLIMYNDGIAGNLLNNALLV